MVALGFDNPVFSQFVCYSILLILETIGIALLVIRIRVKRKVFSFPEDCSQFIVGKHHLKPTADDAQIKRLRRCHLNNLENIVPFVTIGLFYVLTEPDPWTAALCFRSFLVTRVVHNIALIQALPQPTRTFSYLAGVIILCFMSLSVFQRGKM
uniref:Microsomal glutathione S-transferase 1 n=1 Tax=Magallana gigas TaxID=29159 RepID=K1Q4L0_MAGGI|eukprot:XP_011419254.1 PREDICTED: microsomal glutathione S-transferase 1 [Crassostrea gigas]